MTSTAAILLLLLQPSGATVSPYTFDITSFTQSLGANELANGGFVDGSAWTLNGTWTIAGGKAVHLTDGGSVIAQNVLTSGRLYEIVFDFGVTAACFELVELSGVNLAPFMNVNGTKTRIGRATNANFDFFSCGDSTIDNASAKAITLNAIQTATANADIRFAFNLPTVKNAGIKSGLWYRMPPAGVPYVDGWQLTSVRNELNTGFDVSLNKWVAGVMTNITGASIGDRTDITLKVVTSGDNHSIYYSEDGIDGTFTQVATTQTDAAFNSATGAAVVYSSGYTPQEFRSAPN